MLLNRAFQPVWRNRHLICEYKAAARLIAIRSKSTRQSSLATSSSGEGQIDTNVKPLGEKVKETTKTASYLGVILLGKY